MKKLIKCCGLITVDAISHQAQRYPSWGDWRTNLKTHQLAVKMSALSDWRYLYLGAIHEIIEATICMYQGITQQQVDKFDFDYEARRVAGKKRTKCGCPITNDPGSDVHAPYMEAHEFAEDVEYKLAKLLDVDRKVYDTACVAETEPFEGRNNGHRNSGIAGADRRCRSKNLPEFKRSGRRVKSADDGSGSGHRRRPTGG